MPDPGRAPERSRHAQPISDPALNWICLLVLVVIWGSAFAGISIGVETMAPEWLVTGRLVFGSLFIAAWIAGASLLKRHAGSGVARPEERSRVGWRTIGWLSLVGTMFTAVPFLCYAVAADSVPSAVLAICNGGTPFFTAIFAHIMIAGDKLTFRRTMGVSLGFAGLAILVGPEALKGASASLTGLLLAIFGAALYAGGNIATRKAPPVSPILSSLIITVSGSIVMLPVAFLSAPFPVDASAASVTAMLSLALGPTAFAMILYVWLIQRAGPVFVSFSTYLSPLWAAGVGVLFLDEPLGWWMVAALALIFTGVAVANARGRSRT